MRRTRCHRHHCPLVQSQEIWAAKRHVLSAATPRMEESSVAAGAVSTTWSTKPSDPNCSSATPHQVAARRPAAAMPFRSRSNMPRPEVIRPSQSTPCGRCSATDRQRHVRRRHRPEPAVSSTSPRSMSASRRLSTALSSSDELPGPETAIALEILRAGRPVFSATTLGQMSARSPACRSAVSREFVSARLLSDDRHGDRAARYVHAPLGRRSPHYDRAGGNAQQYDRLN